MAIETLTDAQIDELLSCAKRVDNPTSRAKTEGKHIRRDYRVTSTDGQHEFVLFSRQSTLIHESFSAGLRWRSKTGEEVILMRCNGSDHPHGNALERQRFSAQAHIHKASERYIVAGRKPETFALPTTEYQSLEGALHHLTELANISDLKTTPDEPDLFTTQ